MTPFLFIIIYLLIGLATTVIASVIEGHPIDPKSSDAALGILFVALFWELIWIWAILEYSGSFFIWFLNLIIKPLLKIRRAICG